MREVWMMSSSVARQDRRSKPPAAMAAVSWRRGVLLGGVGLLLAALAMIGSGCYNHRAGNPVDRHHYDHIITVVADFSHVTILTYINRTHLQVGTHLEALYDGNRDGKLNTEGFDRIAITDYADVEDPSDKAVRTKGELRDYDDLFQRILSAAKAGKKSFKIEDRRYELRLMSENVAPLADHRLG
jgi:hypothetical protein